MRVWVDTSPSLPLAALRPVCSGLRSLLFRLHLGSRSNLLRVALESHAQLRQLAILLSFGCLARSRHGVQRLQPSLSDPGPAEVELGKPVILREVQRQGVGALIADRVARQSERRDPHHIRLLVKHSLIAHGIGNLARPTSSSPVTESRGPIAADFQDLPAFLAQIRCLQQSHHPRHRGHCKPATAQVENDERRVFEQRGTKHIHASIAKA
mmetsp:Transcript_21522/g.55025  ORF Transcript_21522/g.55025 Transcript_21522/m.55025 type:complete len:211 (+) Transcript_21522:1-633(+)